MVLTSRAGLQQAETGQKHLEWAKVSGYHWTAREGDKKISSSQYEIMKGDMPLGFVQATEQQGSQQMKLPARLVTSSIPTPSVTETDQGEAMHQRGCNVELLHWSGEGRNDNTPGMTATKKMTLVKACIFPSAWWHQAWWSWCTSTGTCSHMAHRWTDRMRHAMAVMDRKTELSSRIC